MEAKQEKELPQTDASLLIRLFGPRLKSSKRFWGLVFVTLYTLFGFLLLPYIIKSQLVSQVPELTARNFSVEEVRFNPYELSLTVSGVSLADKDGVELAGFDEFHANFQLSSLFRWAWTFRDIRIDGPRGNVRIGEDGNVSFQDLLAVDDAAVETKPETAMPRVVVHRLAVNDGHFLFSDRSLPTPYKQKVEPITFELTGFSTLPERDGPYQVKLELPDGGQLVWRGDVSVNPLQATGSVEISALKVRTIWRYLQDQLNFSIDAGQLGIRADYHFAMAAQGPELTVEQMAVNLAGLAIRDKGRSDPDLAIKDVSLSNGRLLLHKQTFELDEIAITGVDLNTFMTGAGELDLIRLFSPVAANDADMQAQDAEPPTENNEAQWQISVARFLIKQSRVAFTDQSTAPAAETVVDNVELALSDISNQSEAAFGLQADMRINQQGTLRVSGKVGALPAFADLSLQLDALALSDFQPYLNGATYLGLENGALKLDSSLQFYSAAVPQLLQVTGNASVQKLLLNHSQTNEKVAALSGLAVNGLDFKLQPDSVAIESIVFEGLDSHILIAEDGGMNVASLVKTEETEAVAVKTQTEQVDAAKPFPISIETVSFKNGALTFVDRTVSPHFSTKLSRFHGSIKGLSSAELAKADVKLNGRVDDVAELVVSGKINPLKNDLYSDIKINFKGYDMTAVTPYTGHYIGNAVDKGLLELELGYRISERTLVGENEIGLDQFTLGRTIASEAAVNLPVGLAIALLKDANGRIDLSVPVRGNLDDPELKISSIVFRALFNVITGIVTSPFKLLANLIGGDEELDRVAFLPGEQTMVAAHESRIQSLAKALQQRPQLRIEVRGMFDPSRDKLAIQAHKSALFFELSEEKGYADLSLRTIQSTVRKQLGKEVVADIKAANMVVPDGEKKGASPKLDEAAFRQGLLQASLEAQPVTESELRDLARARAGVIRSHLIEDQGLAAERVFLREAEADTSADEAGVLTQFQLTTN